MSDIIVIVYLVVTSGLIAAHLYHKGMGHTRIFSDLMVWTTLGFLFSGIGGLLIHVSFTPGMAAYNITSQDFYHLLTWGGFKLPEYNKSFVIINNLGTVIIAMGLALLVMTMLVGFFPRYFYADTDNNEQKRAGKSYK